MIAVDEQLRDLITQVCRHPNPSPQRQKALNRLLIVVAKLPGIYHSSHQDYATALNRTFEWLCQNIDRFDAIATRESDRNLPDVEKSFVRWINGYLKWRIRDLSAPDRKYPVSLNQSLGNEEGESIELGDILPDAKFLNSLEDLIAREQENKRQRQGEAVRQYIEQDPDKKLSNCHPRKHPQCHCQILAIKLHLQEPPMKISVLAREFNVNHQTLYSHWKQKCLPILKEIASRFGN